tara:strand:- start:8904 stop:11435 length:2532 start_codon:yes stop_codon:yes gene_type:complete
MQILELYIRDGIRYYGNATSTSTNNLVDANANFTGTVEVGYIVFNELDGTSAKVTAVTNATTLALSDNIFTINEAYIIKSDFKRLDLFEDESVSITDTIKNVKDVAKIFTPFSQQFNVPASKHNSKIFRHYQDSDIIDSFDARYKADALIKLNGSDYKKGKIRLNSVSLKDNKPHAYKLIFFGDTIELKDLMGETMLSGLNYDASDNFAYSHAVIYPMFTGLGDVCFPLITHTKLMRYNNSAYISSSPTADQKLNYRDLKPAIKIKKILDAIENTFDEINFSGEFFNSEDFNSIYMWMHREKGFMSNAAEGGGLTILEGVFHDTTDSDFTLVSGNEVRPLTPSPPDFITGLGGVRVFINIRITTGSASDVFDLRVENATYPQIVYLDTTGNTGSTSYAFNDIAGSFYAPVNVRIILTSTNTFTISNFEVIFGSSIYESDALAVANTVVIGRQMPKIKTIDFLTNLFKMFNLVAYKVGTEIRVLPLNEYYEEGLEYDITKYVDTTKNSISKVLQFKNIDFNFPSKESFLVEKSDELQGANFAGESFSPDPNLQADGTDYKIEPVFEKMLYERLSDETSGTLTTICQGAMLDKDFNATIGKPLLLYIANQTATPNFAFANADGGSDETVTAYNRPSQILVQSDGSVLAASSSLNFGIERDEFFLEPKGTNLLAKYYLNYIESVFNRQARINKLEAYLPLHIILKYQLNDRFVVGNKLYRINSIKTNLLTNKSSLELYSLSQATQLIQNSQFETLPRLAALNVTATSSSSVTLGWTAAGALNTDNITGYDVYKDDTFVETLGNDISGRTLTGLTSKITYKLAIRTRYTIDSSVVFSNDRIVYATTD